MDLRKEEAIISYRLDLAEEKGIKIGQERGIQVGEERGQNLLKAGVSVDLVTESTGLPKAGIVQLQEEIA